MAFHVGTAVAVLSLGRKRGTIVHAGRDGRYRVQVESLTITCREADLAAVEPSGRKPSARADRGGRIEPTPPEADAPPGRIDLHGLTVDEAVAQVTRAIDEALRRGADRVEIVHGKGTGRVKEAVHRHLAALPIVAAFRQDPRNPGVTWAWLR